MSLTLFILNFLIIDESEFLILIKRKFNKSVIWILVLVSIYNYNCSLLKTEMNNTITHYGHHHVILSAGRQ